MYGSGRLDRRTSALDRWQALRRRWAKLAAVWHAE